MENKQEEHTQKLLLCACLGGGGWWWLLRLLSSKMTAAVSVGVVSGDTESDRALAAVGSWVWSSEAGGKGQSRLCILICLFLVFSCVKQYHKNIP